ncbi:MAG: flagellar protein FlgN [Rhodocyclales bacterium]|nr:flagellar protein FlgN [Rhodocyclales bacterium]MDB5888986.1 flagellar protein FlgN [Rhodocyclales bacterium]
MSISVQGGIDQGALRQRLISLLGAERDLVRDFIALLGQERETLSHADMEPLFALSERKGQVVRQLDQLSTARIALLAQAGLPHDREGIQKLLGDAGAPTWNEFLAAAEQARNINLENGRIITERMKNNHQALAVLMAHADQPTTYGRDGMSRTRPGSRILGSV